MQYDATGELISSGDLGKQGSKDCIGIQPGARQNVIERAVRCEHLVPITPACDGFVLIAYELAPLSIKCLDDAESTPPAGCARHGDDSDKQVLSDVLVETPRVLPIWGECCQ